jgi:hypothetical protein
MSSKDLEMATAKTRAHGRRTRGVETIQTLGTVIRNVWLENGGMIKAVALTHNGAGLMEILVLAEVSSKECAILMAAMAP